VVNGDLPDEEVKATIDKFTKIISGQGGTLVSLEEWGRRKLAYKIAGTLRGYYVKADFAGMPAAVKELERNYRIDDRVIRYLTMKKADQVDLAALEAEIASKIQEASPPTTEAEKVTVEAAPVETPAAPTSAAEPAETESETPAVEPDETESAAIPEKEA
jgi:small subunit ribosomal protein S6